MANSVRIVHTADLHLGSPFGYFPERAEVLQADQLRTFMSIVRLCQDSESDLLLIAGDLFEQPRPPASLVVCR
jgi:DNA repair exonuclease SbcCD nuclease subunit